jgi:ubiquinone/menaquinone biosynthesis C-methylase UbiE
MKFKQIFEKLIWIFYKPVYRPYLNEGIYYQLKKLPKNKILRIIYGSISRNYELIVNERIVEYPFVFQNLNLKKGSKILDFGCCESKLSIELASLGYKVVGIDLNDYEFSHPNFKFIKGDFLENDFKNESFDAIIAVSALEHVGLNVYGNNNFEEGDYKVINEFYRILKKGGQLIITLPFGKRGETFWYKVYDDESLRQLLKNYKIEKIEYFIGKNRKYWKPVAKDEILKVDSTSKNYVQGIACIKVIKNK